jgi:alkaline phosphatase D
MRCLSAFVLSNAGVPDAEAVSNVLSSAPSLTGRVVFAVGSCCKLTTPDERAPVFDTIADLKPDLMLWLGDNWYLVGSDLKESSAKRKGKLIRGEWSTETGMLARARFVHQHPDLQRVLKEIPNYATWDDHDFGYNNAPLGDPETLKPREMARVFAGRQAALRVFRTIWSNPSYGTEENPGAFCAFRRGPVAFFLVDDRYYKDVKRGAIWGSGQLAWLKEELLRAERDALPVKIIGNGCQVLATTGKESFDSEAPGELEDLLSFIVEHNIRNVLFLSGDRHRSELWIREWRGRQFVELTASPFYHTLLRVDPKNYARRVWVGEPVCNFGLVTVEVPAAGQGYVELEVRDSTGLTMNNLGPTRAPPATPCRGRFDLRAGRLVE